MVLALARPSEPWCFPPGSDFFEPVLLLAAASNRICRKIVFSRMSDDTLGTSIYLVYISIGFQTSRLAIFSFIWHQWVSRTWARARKRAATAAAAEAAAAARQQHHSSSSHQQQHQQQAAGRRQQAAGSSRQQQASVGSSRHKQTQQQ